MHRLVVVDRNNVAKGIVSLSDILQCLVLTAGGEVYFRVVGIIEHTMTLCRSNVSMKVSFNLSFITMAGV